jgi:hypothetical protein
MRKPHNGLATEVGPIYYQFNPLMLNFYKGMEKVYKAVLLSFGIALSLASCNKDVVAPTNDLLNNNQSSSVSQQPISVVNGRMRFSDQKVLRNTLTSLRTLENMMVWEAKYPDFKSMRKAYDELVRYDIGKALTDGSIDSFKGVYRIVKESNGDKSYERAIFDQSLSTVLNAQGVFQIGDSLYRVSEQKTIALPIQYEAELSNELPAHGVVRTVIHRYATSSSPNARPAGSHDDVNIEYHPDGLTVRRFRGVGVSTNYAFSSDQHWEAGYKVWHQRNNWWGWGGEYADYIFLHCKVTVNGQLRYSAGGIYPSEGSAGASDLIENEFKFTEGWTSATVGLVRVEYDWIGTGNGTQGGAKPVINRANSWQENI